MVERSETAGQSTDSRDELRTISFRLREIQHLLAMRVAQENRRMESEGIDPVEDPPFVDRKPRREKRQE